MKVEDLLIGTDTTLVEALRRLDQTAKSCLFVVDRDARLIASLTDGDVRRYILANGTIEGLAIDAANKEPHSVRSIERDTAADVLARDGLSAVPVVGGSGAVVDVVFRDLSSPRERLAVEDPLPVVMMAGGKGTRLMPFTAVLPKPLIPVNGKTIAERIIERFYVEGCEDFYLVLNYKRRMIKAFFGELEPPYRVHFVDEDEYLGTGGGVKLVEGLIDSTFILTNCDILVDVDVAELLRTHRKLGNAVTVVCSLKDYTIPYGTIEIGEGGRIEGMSEKPTIPSLINTGCYMVEPEVLGLIGEAESIGFPDVMLRCQEAGLKVGAFPVSEGSWLDMGQPEELEHMSEALRVRGDADG